MPVPRSERRSRSRSRHRDARSSNPLVPGAIVVLLAALVAGAWWMGQRTSVPTDAGTLCRTDVPPPATHAVLIDVTDTLSSGERVQVLNEIERLRMQLPRFALLEIYAIDSAATPEAALISICNPGRGADMNSLYQNPAMAERRWEEEFRDRLIRTLDDVVTRADSQQSLILEAVRAVATESFGRVALDGSEKHLTVFSDLLQHAPGEYSQYSRPLADYGTFRQGRYGHATRTNLSGVHVRVFYIERPSTHHLQDGSHQKFWFEYFQAGGAVVEGFKKIFGD